MASLKDDVIMSGIGLPNEYKVAQLHFHFGSNEKKGSEHTIDGKAYAMEVCKEDLEIPLPILLHLLPVLSSTFHFS